MNAAIKDQQAELRRLKELRPKCSLATCDKPSMLSKALCAEHYRQNQESLQALHRGYERYGAPTETRIYVCPQCLDTTDDPSHLCKCLD